MFLHALKNVYLPINLMLWLGIEESGCVSPGLTILSVSLKPY